MNKLAHILTIAITVSFLATTSCMDNRIIIKTADNQECKLPQWKIEASRLLHTKQELQAFKEKYSGETPAPITLKTISAEKLYLFSNVLDEHDILAYVKKLSEKKRNLLLSTVRPQELDSPYIMCELLRTYFQQDFLEEHINPHLPTIEMANCLKGLVIKDNCEYKKFTHTRTENYEDYVAVTGNGGYHRFPAHITNFSGITSPITDTIDSSDDKWLIENFTDQIEENICFLTPMKPVNNVDDYLLQMHAKENKKRLWIKYPKKDTILRSTIEHTDPIICNAFSNDGKYLATGSKGPNGQLILTNLSIENNIIDSGMFLKGHTGSINCICFNKQSTILAAAGEEGIYFWNTQTSTLLAQFRIAKVTNMQFNHNGTRLAMISSLQDDFNHRIMIFSLWDITDFNNITTIKNHISRSSFKNITFTPLGDNIIVQVGGGALVLNGWSGEVIMETNLKENYCIGSAVLMSYNPILATTNYNDLTKCSITLWDINSKECITTLLENEKCLTGVGVSDDNRFVIATNDDCEMITTELYDNDTHDCLQWIQNNLNLTQRYLLLRLYSAYKNNDRVFLDYNSAEYRTLQNLPTKLCVKAMIEKYLLKK